MKIIITASQWTYVQSELYFWSYPWIASGDQVIFMCFKSRISTLYFRLHTVVYNHVGYQSCLGRRQDGDFNVNSQDFVLFLFDNHT